MELAFSQLIFRAMYLLKFLSSFEMKNSETNKNAKNIKKAKKIIMKQLKESIMNDENVNKDIEESARKDKNSEVAAEVVKETEKIIKSNKCNIL